MYRINAVLLFFVTLPCLALLVSPDIWAQEVKAERIQLLTSGVSPAWRNEHSLLFARPGNGVYSLDLKTTQPDKRLQQLHKEKPLSDWTVLYDAFSGLASTPDGSKFVFGWYFGLEAKGLFKKKGYYCYINVVSTGSDNYKTLFSNYVSVDWSKRFELNAKKTQTYRITSIEFSPNYQNVLFDVNNKIFIADVLAFDVPKELHSGSFPTWTPTGGMIFYYDEGSIYRMTSSGLGSKKTSVTVPSKIQVSGMALSPDGKLLALSYSNVVVIQDLDGSNRRVFELPIDRVANIDWSPNGNRLAFDNGKSIYTLDL